MQENHLGQDQETLKKALAHLASSHVTLPLSSKLRNVVSECKMPPLPILGCLCVYVLTCICAHACVCVCVCVCVWCFANKTDSSKLDGGKEGFHMARMPCVAA